MTNAISGTFTVEPLVSIKIEGYKPLPPMRKKSEWNGMWELRTEQGQALIIMPKSGGVFSDVVSIPLGRCRGEVEPAEFVVISVSPLLLELL